MYISYLKGRKKTEGTGGNGRTGGTPIIISSAHEKKKSLKVLFAYINKIIIGVTTVPSVPLYGLKVIQLIQIYSSVSVSTSVILFSFK